MYENDSQYFGDEGTQPELYDPENREFVGFDKFKGFEKFVKKFEETLKNFDNTEKFFFGAISYVVMFYRPEGKILDRNKIKDVLGNDFYNDLLEIKDDI